MSFVDCVGNPQDFDTTCSVHANSLAQVGRLAASRDGKRLYTVATYGIWSFDVRRDGGLAAVGCTRHRSTKCEPSTRGEAQLSGGFMPIAISSDSRYVYVLNAVVPDNDFTRTVLTDNARTTEAPGLLLVQTKLLPRTFADPTDIEFSPDGSIVYVAVDPGIIGLARNKASGRVSSIRSCLVDAFSRRGEGAYVPGCQRFPIDADFSGSAQSVARLSGETLVVAGGGGGLVAPEARRRGFWIKACVINVQARLCPSRVKAFEYPPEDAAVLESGTIVLSNQFALFSVAVRNVNGRGGVRVTQ